MEEIRDRISATKATLNFLLGYQNEMLNNAEKKVGSLSNKDFVDINELDSQIRKMADRLKQLMITENLLNKLCLN